MIGNLDVRVSIKRKDEIGILATTFNQMSKQLQNLLSEAIQSAIAKSELQKGREIQQNFLPSSIPQIAGWEIATVFKPARQVSGDFYDIFKLENGQASLLADVGEEIEVGDRMQPINIENLNRIKSLVLTNNYIATEQREHDITMLALRRNLQDTYKYS